eukprot:CAMPEP_0171162692 /NCGR_PEP_ID=MMETSP0790-20130122/4724_1 /TAXON_ID=2925 /ORGANISM="Alexandrium catenella, Strain OF101" /LENGTH=666 /DNA_ID=CAMNT_0011627305 /DNA_START=167 /DNA_END=2166 /DNA_ORIENTATION=-
MLSLSTFFKAQRCLTWQERAMRATVVAITGAALLCAGTAAVIAVVQGLVLGALGIGAFQITQYRQQLMVILAKNIRMQVVAISATSKPEPARAVEAGPSADKKPAPAGKLEEASSPSSSPQPLQEAPVVSDDMKAFGEALGAVRFRAAEQAKAAQTPREPGRVAAAVSAGAALALLSGTEPTDEDIRWKPPSPEGLPTSPIEELKGPRAMELRRSIQRLLNRVCPENVGTIVEQLADIKLANDQELAFMIRTLFKRALLDPHYCETYADLAFGLYTVSRVPQDGSNVPFSGLLVDVCHSEFEALRVSFKEISAEANGCDSEEMEFEFKKTKDKMLALMTLIGNLFLRRLMSTSSIGAVIADLLCVKVGVDFPTEYEIECACEILKSVGATLQADPASEQIVSVTFKRLAELRKAKDAKGKDAYCRRLQFAVQDLIDLRKAGWVKKIFKSLAKTKDEIRCDAANEEEMKHQGEDGVQRIVAGVRPQTIAGTKVSWGEADPVAAPIAAGGDCKKELERSTSQVMYLPWGWAGKIIGPKGETARIMQEETGARIWVDRQASQARVSGSAEAVAAAEKAIKAILPPGSSLEWRQVPNDEETSIGSSSCYSSRSISGCSSTDSETQWPEKSYSRQERGRATKQQASKAVAAGSEGLAQLAACSPPRPLEET